MTTVIIETFINAPAETCFDLVRDARVHTSPTDQENNLAVAGVTDVKFDLGQTVTFEGTRFGMSQRLTVRVVEFDRPTLFVDEMIEGRFKAFKHIHEFNPHGTGTVIKDTLIWTSPFGILGKIVDAMLLKGHLRNLVSARNSRLKAIAEGRDP